MATELHGPTEQCPANHAGAFATVVEDHWTAVFRTLWSMTGNAHDAEELTQETFLRALRRFESFQPGTQLRAWLLRIAINACLDLRRKQKRTRRVALPDDLAEIGQQPGYRLETAEQCQLLLAALKHLSETTRTVFHLRATESLSFREIGRLLQISEDAARWHMHRARTKLLNLVQGPEGRALTPNSSDNRTDAQGGRAANQSELPLD